MSALNFSEDHHVHTTFSDGRASVLEMAREAKARGLTRLGFADHVREDSDWLEGYVEAVEEARAAIPGIRLDVGVEAKILDHYGRIDLPKLPAGVDQVVIADHQYPGVVDPLHPRVVKEELLSGTRSVEDVVSELVWATVRAVRSCPKPVVVGHLFSILPKVGIEHGSFPAAWADPVFRICKTYEARLEIDERWRSPGVAVARRALEKGVQVVCSSDSHQLRPIGRYSYVRTVA